MSNYIIHREEDEDYLEHFGVRGMHWGVRRYQNEDGSYKPGAEGRYAPDGQPGVNKKRSGGSSSSSGTSKPKYGKDGMSDTERKLVFGPRGENSIAYKLARKTGMINDYDPEKLKKLNEDAARKDKEKADKKAAKEKEKAAKDAEKEAKNKQLQEIDGLSDTERKMMYGVLAENNPIWKMKYGKKADTDKKSEGEAVDKKEAERQKKEAAKEEAKAAKEAEKKQKQELKTKYWQEQFKLAEQEEAARKEKKAAEKQAKEEAKAAKKAEKEAKNKQLQDIDGMTSVERKLMYGVLGENNPLWKKKYGGKLKQSDYSEYDYELYHHGILGMHWGIRRFQNEDGTLTAAGKKRYRTDEDVNKYGKTRKEVIDRLNKGAEKLASKSDEYYDKSQYSKEEKAFKRMQAQKAYENRDDENYKNKDDFSSYKSKLKEFDVYDEDNDKDYQMSKKLSDKANDLSMDAHRLGKDYVRNNKIMGTTLAALAGGYAGLKIADANGLSGKKFVASMLASSIASAAVANVATGKLSNHIQNKTEKKYGFR